MIAARRAGVPLPVSSGGSVAGSPINDISGIPPELAERLKKETQAEVEKILKEKGYAEAEIANVQAQLKESSERAKQQRQERNDLEKKLHEMEEKLSGGGTKRLIDENQKQKALLQQHQLELEAKKAEQIPVAY